MSMNDLLNMNENDISIIDEEKKIVVDSKVYLSYMKFLEVKFGIVTIAQLTTHEAMTTIISTMGACVDISSRLLRENLISDNVDEKVREDVNRAKSYIEYTNESSTVFLTLEKLFQVCRRIFIDFKLMKKDYAVMVSFKHETNSDKVMNINDLIAYVVDLYVSKNKKVILEKEAMTNNQILFLCMKKRYNNEIVPRNLNDLSIQWLKNLEPFDIAELTPTLNVERLVNALVDDNNEKVEPSFEQPGFVRNKCELLTSSVIEPDRIVSFQTAKIPELESFVATMVSLKITPENSSELISSYLNTINDVPDSTLKVQALEQDFSVFNTSWITAPKNPINEVQREAVEAAKAYMTLLRSTPHILIYCKLTHECYKVKHKFGMTFSEPKFVIQFVKVLPKLFHYIVYLGTFFSKDKVNLDKHIGAVCSLIASQFSGNVPSVRKIISYVLAVNYKIWSRDITITEFPEIKDSYLPTSIVGMRMDELDEKVVEEIPDLFIQ